MDNRDRLLRYLEETHKEMLTALNGIDLRQEIFPDWSLKEMLAHIAGWDEVTYKGIDAFLAGGEPYILAPQSYDKTNAEMAAAREELNLQEIIEDWKRSRADLIRSVKRIPEVEFETTILFPWGPSGSIREMIEIIAEHELEHARELSHRIRNA